MRKQFSTALAAMAACVLTGVAHAGPVVIDGTDANDHGSVSAGVNQNGWLYMQRVLENLGSNVTTTAARVVTVLGTAAGQGQAFNSIQSAFSLSSLNPTWTINYVDGAANITTFMNTLSTTNTGILYMSTVGQSGGDMSTAELAAVNAASAQINNFVSGAGNSSLGGALFTQAQTGAGAYGWLTALLPGIVATDAGGVGTDIVLTAAGAAAFPGLTNAALAGADPWHGYFSGNLGGLSVLGTAPDGNATRAVIIGGGTGTVFQCGQPGQPACGVSEPGTLPLIAAASLALFGLRRSQGKRRLAVQAASMPA